MCIRMEFPYCLLEELFPTRNPSCQSKESGETIREEPSCLDTAAPLAALQGPAPTIGATVAEEEGVRGVHVLRAALRAQ